MTSAAGGQAADPEALQRVVLPLGGSGLLLGRDSSESPVLVRLFRPEPTVVTLVGGWWAARLVAFRALAAGASLAVHSAAAAEWGGFGEMATKQPGSMAVVDPVSVSAVPATRRRPVLYVHDSSGAVGTPVPALGAWQTALVVLPQLTGVGARLLADAHACLLQRLTESEAVIAASMLWLAKQSVTEVQMMSDDMIALVGGGANRYVWLTMTSVERHYFGSPRRT